MKKWWFDGERWSASCYATEGTYIALGKIATGIELKDSNVVSCKIVVGR
jgi:hypothetical protein